MAHYCMMQCGNECDATKRITVEKWNKIKTKCEEWSGLHKFTDSFDTISWETGPTGYFICNSCNLTLFNTRSLSQAQNKRKRSLTVEHAAAESNNSSSPNNVTAPKPPSPKRLRSSIGVLHFPKTKCVWCMNGEDDKHPDRKTGKLSRLETQSAWRAFKRHVVLIEDESLRVRIERLAESTSQLSDPFANDIMYHYSCWMKYVTNPLKNPMNSRFQRFENVTRFEMKNIFLRYVDNIIFKDHEIRSVQSLLLEYQWLVVEYGYSCGEVRGSFIKELLIREYGSLIGFRERKEKNKSELVYDAEGGGDYVDLALTSLGISDEQLLQNFSTRLGTNVKDTPHPPWPPRIDELEEDEEFSEILLLLLSRLKNMNKEKIKDNPILQTLSSLITYYVTGKRTNTAISIAVVIHGLTRSREIIDMLHKCGLCISYADLLLLYDSWALLDAEATCPVEIADNKPPIVIVDNDDFKIDTLTGNASSAHRTNVMFVQPKAYEEERSEISTSFRCMKKKVVTEKLSEKCAEMTAVQQYICPRGSSSEPPVRDTISARENGTATQRIRSVIHVLARADSNGARPLPKDQIVPAYSGMQSCLLPATAKSKPYYHATYNEPPKKSVMNDIMTKLVATMKDKNMPFSFLVGDLPTYKLIVELKAENPAKYEEIIPIIGAFHQQMSFIYAIYKRFLGSGISELLVSAGVIVEGSVDQALRGKHYRRGIRCIMLWREVLIQKRLRKLLENKSLSEDISCNLDTLRKALDENKDDLACAYGQLEDDEDIKKLVDEVYEKPGTDMGDYWLSFMEMSDVLLQNVDACHVRNLDEYLSSTHDMFPGLLAYNNHDYGRWLPDYWAMINDLSYEKKKYFAEHFSQSMTGLPYSCQPMDLWIETTMNLNSKLKQGWLHLLQNEKQLFTTTRNANNVARVKSNMKRNLNCQRRHQKHVDCQPARMKKDEQAIQDLLMCIEDFEADPFDDSSPALRSLQSGVTASTEILADLESALEEGSKQAKDILQKRVFSKELPLSATISRNKRLNLASTPVATKSGSCSVEQMEKTGLATLIDYAEKRSLIDLETLLEKRITEECLSMYNVDGSLRKTAKSKLLQCFSREQQIEKLLSYSSLVDMGLIWRLATPTADDRDCKKRSGDEYKWKDYLDKVCSMVFTRHVDADILILINDNYVGSSIKDDEHDRRAFKHINLPNVYPKETEKFPSPAQFKKILLKSENKVRLQTLLKQRFKARSQEFEGQVIYCVGGTVAENLTTGADMNDYCFDQAEADTILLSAYNKLRENGYTDDVVIDSEDTDVYVQASYVSHVLPGNLLIKHKNSLFSCKELVSSEISKVIIPFHILTGCDHTSGFFGKGKKSVLNKLKKDKEAQELLHGVGQNLQLDDNVRKNMKKFVLMKIYGENVDSCGKARTSQWRKMKKKSMARLPPDDDTLNHHCDRTNYLSYCLQHYELQQHPSPIGHGYQHINGRCRPLRYKQSALPECTPQATSLQALDSDDSDSEYGESSDNCDSDED